MKKILIFAACVVAFASCNQAHKNIELYCEQDASRLYNEVTEEMDTLSYAAGMNLGLVVSIQNADFDLDTEAIIAILDRELHTKGLDEKAMEKHNEFLGNFSNERVRPFMMAKQAQSRIVTDRPDTLTLPALYDETYTKERFTESFATMMSNALRQQRIPANLHWLYTAIRDAAGVKDKSEIDSVMRISEARFFEIMTAYTQNDIPAYNAELSNKWYERVSTKPGVEELLSPKGDKTGVYYRINNAGGELKPANATDSIAVKYAVYSRTGKLLESNAMFIDNLKKQREQVANNKMMPDSMRQNYIKQIDDEIAKSDIRQLPLNRFMQKDVQEAVKLVGKGGNITMWMDAARAFGFRANRLLPMNEAVVINVELLDFKTIAPAPKPVGMKKPSTKGEKAAIVPAPQTVTPNK